MEVPNWGENSQSAGKPRERHEPATKWKLVEMRCEALADAAKGARLPYLLALMWAFVWSACLYTGSVGYVRMYQARYVTLERHFAREFSDFGVSCEIQADPSLKRKCVSIPKARVPAVVSGDLTKACGRMEQPIGTPADDAARTARVKDCAQEIANRVARSVDRAERQILVTLPGLAVPLHYSDLGIVGALGLILLLAWLFFALRRENHAIASFVRIRPFRSDGPSWSITGYEVVPQERYWSAEHYAFAYNAVSQRFLFLFSTHSRTTQGIAVLLTSFPAIVASVSFATDIYSAIGIIREMRDNTVVWRLIAEFALLGIVLAFTVLVVRYVVLSNRLLNAWYLATQGVWMDEWDETNQNAASVVRIEERKRAVAKTRPIADAPAPDADDANRPQRPA